MPLEGAPGQSPGEVPGYTQRYLRQIALPEIGPDGQQRIAGAVIAVATETGADDGVTGEIAARYLAAAGVGTLRLIGVDVAPSFTDGLRASNPDVAVQARAWPRDGAAWLAALDGVDLVVRSGFDDDPMLRAAARLGIPAIVLRARPDRVELVSFRRHGPCPHLDLDVPRQRGGDAARGAQAGAAAVVAGTLGASEALFVLVGRAGAGDGAPQAAASRARHLSVPLDGGAPRAQEIPWAPACFACGGGAVEMVFP